VISVGFARLADLAQTAFAGITASGEWTFLLSLGIAFGKILLTLPRRSGRGGRWRGKKFRPEAA
jgi:hypothetical protein